MRWMDYVSAYMRTQDLYKKKIKFYHDKKIEKQEFTSGDKLLLFDLRIKLFLIKLQTKIDCPYIVSTVFPYGAVELVNKYWKRFKVNSQ